MKKKVNLIVDVLREEEKLIINKLKSKNIEYEILLVDKIKFDLKNNSFNQNEVFLNRSPSYWKSKFISEYIESKGGKVYNSSNYLNIFGDKSRTDLWLSRNNINIIPGIICFSVQQAINFAEQIQYPIIMKPVIGGFGNLVHQINSSEEFQQNLEIYEKFAPSSKKVYYIQKKINIVKDVRVFSIDGNIIASVERFNKLFKKNIAQGGNSELYNLNLDELNYIQRITSLLHDSILGIDLLVDNLNNYYICDINPVCLFKDTMIASNIDIPGKIVEFLISKI